MIGDLQAYTAFTAQWKEQIDAALDRYLAFSPSPSSTLHDSMRYSVLSPGKRTRPLLCLMAAEACGAEPINALPAACAVEMVHAFSLIHDDLPCMDDDDLRRGKPTNHRVYGEAMALLAGDAILVSAFEILAENLPASIAAACVRELAKASGATGMAEGQALDIEAGSESTEVLDALNELKTGALIACALRMGALTAGASENHLAALSLYGKRLGLAFQIVDDLIDATGSQEAAGKKVGKDLEKGKKTYPYLIGVEASQARVNDLLKEAEEALQAFDASADPLRSMLAVSYKRDR